MRPLVSTALRLAGYPPLPPPGRMLDLGFLSHLAVIPGEEATVPSLLAGLLRLARNNGLASVVLGLSEAHPWLALLNGLHTLRYRSQLYLVHWPEGRKYQFKGHPNIDLFSCLVLKIHNNKQFSDCNNELFCSVKREVVCN